MRSRRRHFPSGILAEVNLRFDPRHPGIAHQIPVRQSHISNMSAQLKAAGGDRGNNRGCWRRRRRLLTHDDQRIHPAALDGRVASLNPPGAPVAAIGVRRGHLYADIHIGAGLDCADFNFRHFGHPLTGGEDQLRVFRPVLAARVAHPPRLGELLLFLEARVIGHGHIGNESRA